MPTSVRGDSLVLLDACVLINLLATNRFEEILGELSYRFATSRLIVEREVMSLVEISGTGSSDDRVVIPPARLKNTKDLLVLELSTDEELTDFIGFASELDDGEASVGALAIHRGGVVATDDRKALRLLSHRAPVLQTPEILWEWADRSAATRKEVAEVLQLVRRRARFHPRWDAPRFDWWSSFF